MTLNINVIMYCCNNNNNNDDDDDDNNDNDDDDDDDDNDDDNNNDNNNNNIFRQKCNQFRSLHCRVIRITLCLTSICNMCAQESVLEPEADNYKHQQNRSFPTSRRICLLFIYLFICLFVTLAVNCSVYFPYANINTGQYIPHPLLHQKWSTL